MFVSSWWSGFNFHTNTQLMKAIYVALIVTAWGTLRRSWLRHCATILKVAGSVPDGVIGIFHWHNPFSRTMALGLTQPLTEMSTRIISGPDDLPTFMCRLSWNLGASTSWKLQGLSSPIMGMLYLLILTNWHLNLLVNILRLASYDNYLCKL
jgi:hypothetical protein